MAALTVDQWNVEFRPWGWLRLRESSGHGPSVYLNYAYSGMSGKERLDLQSVVMRSGGDEGLSARVWRRIPLSAIEKQLTIVLSLARNAPTDTTARAVAQVLESFRSSDVDPPTLDILDEYFEATKDLAQLVFGTVPSNMLVSDGTEGLPPGRIPRLVPPEGGGRLTDEFLTDVADTYHWVISSGRRPGPAIAEMTGNSVRTVHRWVYEARKRGILPPARSGRAG